MTKFCALILEDAVVTSIAISRALDQQLPDAQILRAQSLFEARLLMQSFDVHYFILDIQLPDGSGIDLLPDIINANPRAGVVIITASPIPKYRDSALQFGVLHFMEKPIDPELLGSLAREYRNIAYASGASSETSFTASLRRLSVSDIVQLKCLGRATIALDFTLRDGRHGTVFFEDGEVVHARVDAHPKTPTRDGIEAFREIMGWRGGKVEDSHARTEERTITDRWQELLLNTAQWLDERGHAAEAPAE
jgi:CheY-like chemotaxis protein